MAVGENSGYSGGWRSDTLVQLRRKAPGSIRRRIHNFVRRVYADGGNNSPAGAADGDNSPKDPGRPSLVLQKAGRENLWSIAKENGSTVSAIREANNLQEEPDPDRILLIPIL